MSEIVWSPELEKEVRRIVREELKALDRQVRAKLGNHGHGGTVKQSQEKKQ